MGAGLGLVGIAAKGASDGMGGIAVIIDDEIGVTSAALEPAVDFFVVLGDGGSDGLFGGVAIGPGGGGGNIVLVAETLAQLIIGSADVFAKRVSAGGFVLGEIAARVPMAGFATRRRGIVGCDVPGYRGFTPAEQETATGCERARKGDGCQESSHGVDVAESLLRGPESLSTGRGRMGDGAATTLSSLPPCPRFWQLGGSFKFPVSSWTLLWNLPGKTPARAGR
jgi:hypothetical protein